MNQRSAEPVEQAFQCNVTLSNRSSSSGGKASAQGKEGKNSSSNKSAPSQPSQKTITDQQTSGHGSEGEAWDWTIDEKERMGIDWDEESVGEPQPEVPSQNTSRTLSSDPYLSHDGATRSSSRGHVFPARLQDYVLTNDNDVSDDELVNFA
ncbi:hypothetical protein U1Q18_017008, partial [Sarracenia purpurea var. burkii]